MLDFIDALIAENVNGRDDGPIIDQHWLALAERVQHSDGWGMSRRPSPGSLRPDRFLSVAQCGSLQCQYLSGLSQPGVGRLRETQCSGSMSEIASAARPLVGGSRYRSRMLRNFLYLNEITLNGYLSALEDGLRSAAEHRTTQTKTLSGKAGVAGFGAQGGTESDTESSRSYSDTSEARFERFMSLSAANPERSGWIDIVNSDDDFPAATPGTILEFDCEIFVPPMIRSLTSSGGIGQAMAMLKSMAPIMNALQPETTELPPEEQIQAVNAMSSLMGDDLALVGERDDTDWRIAGRLIAASIRDNELDGAARVVGKVSAVLRPGEHKSLLALPGMNLMTREQRRAQAKAGPKTGEEANWLTGPAVMLDVLAVYR